MLIKESSNNDGAVTGRKSFFISIYFIKKKNGGEGGTSWWECRLNTMKSFAVGEVVILVRRPRKQTDSSDPPQGGS